MVFAFHVIRSASQHNFSVRLQSHCQRPVRGAIKIDPCLAGFSETVIHNPAWQEAYQNHIGHFGFVDGAGNQNTAVCLQGHGIDIVIISRLQVGCNHAIRTKSGVKVPVRQKPHEPQVKIIHIAGAGNAGEQEFSVRQQGQAVCLAFFLVHHILGLGSFFRIKWNCNAAMKAKTRVGRSTRQIARNCKRADTCVLCVSGGYDLAIGLQGQRLNGIGAQIEVCKYEAPLPEMLIRIAFRVEAGQCEVAVWKRREVFLNIGSSTYDNPAILLQDHGAGALYPGTDHFPRNHKSGVQGSWLRLSAGKQSRQDQADYYYLFHNSCILDG